MYWIQNLQNAIHFIEDNSLDDLDIEEIAKHANSSGANFQRIFSIVTGITAGGLRLPQMNLQDRKRK
jgi:AraC family transcriptional regulator